MISDGVPRPGRPGTLGWIDLHLYAMALATLLTGLLLWWTNASWRESFEAYPPVLEKLRLVRSDAVKAYLAVERLAAGQQHVRPSDVEAYFEQALDGCHDIASAMARADPRPDAEDGQPPLLGTLDRYAKAIAAFRELARQSMAANPAGQTRLGVERQAAFAVLEKFADSLDDEVQRRMAAVATRQDKLNNILFFAWLSFLTLLAVSLAVGGARRRRAEQAMLESEEKYRSLFDQVRDAILVIDEDTGRILDCNRAVAAEWGYAPGDLVGKTPDVFSLDADGTAQPTAVRGQNGSLTTIREARLRTKSGEQRQVSIKSGLFTLGTSRVRLEIFRDMTELRQEERALRERETMLRSLGDNLPDGVIYTLEIDAAGNRRFLYVSQGLERILGLPVAAALGDAQRVLERIEATDRERLLAAESESRGWGVSLDVQARVITPSGDLRWGQFRAAPRPGADGSILLDGFYFDVSAQKRIEADMGQAMAAAQAASQAKSEFLANISHEIRTPLNGVLGMLQLLEGASLGGEEAQYVATALACGRGLSRILADILDFSLLEAGTLILKSTPTDIREIVADVMGVLSVECRAKGIASTVEVAREVPARVLADAARLRQIVFNIVGNAVKFTENGSVRLEVALASQRGETAMLFFTVTDTGIGMPESTLDTIFEPFTQVDGSLTRPYGGTGLGLGIVKRLLTLLDGVLTVESRVGVGSRFDFIVPCRLMEAQVPDASLPRQPALDATAARVLVVEDDAVNRMATVMMLKKMGYAVEAAEDGDLALDALAAQPFDVVLMDIQMPRLSGDEATRRIRRGEHPGVDKAVPIIALTAHAMEGDRERYFQCGMNDYLAKPVDVGALREAVQRAVTKRQEAARA
jgi:PAS domain S-box-containing protein